MNPPSGVRITTALMFLSILVGIVVAFTQPLPPVSVNVPPEKIALFVHIVVIVLALIEALFVFFYFKGKNWARWLVMLDSLYQVVLLARIGKAWSMSHISASLVIANGLLAIYLLWYLNTDDAKRYFTPGSPDLAPPPVAL